MSSKVKTGTTGSPFIRKVPKLSDAILAMVKAHRKPWPKFRFDPMVYVGRPVDADCIGCTATITMMHVFNKTPHYWANATMDDIRRDLRLSDKDFVNIESMYGMAGDGKIAWLAEYYGVSRFSMFRKLDKEAGKGTPTISANGIELPSLDYRILKLNDKAVIDRWESLAYKIKEIDL